MALRRRDSLEAKEGVDVRRMAREGAGSILYSLIVMAAVALVLVMSYRANRSWDFSAQQSNSLAPQTVEALARLTDDVQVKALYTAKHPERERYWELLQRYRDASARVEVEFIDPVARPGAVRSLGLDLSDESMRQDGASVAIRGDRKVVFRGVKEEDVTNAILEAGSNRKRVVGFVRGYGEADTESPGDTGLRSVADALRAEYYETRDVFLAAGIPDDVTVLITAGPKVAIPAADLDRLERWLAKGGRLLVLSDVGADVGLDAVLEPWGLGAVGRQILDPRDNVNGRAEFLRITEFTGHPVSRGFGKNLPAALPIAGAVRYFDGEDPRILHDTLFRSSRFSESLDAEGKRVQGPFDVGVAAWMRLEGADEEEETRIVLIGDVDFATNAFVSMSANRNLFLNAVGWLARAEGLVSIRNRPLAGQTLELGPMGPRGLYLVVAFAPLAVVITGILVFLRRRGL